ncbi:hypothetical protein ASPTUDRAFT_683924 [Aspergillus tubingensis CBS 134.48]|uniref:Uncharacterized protein n=1 Tax=Aspergillus tubingensis (strain CBS 134.48) TaxID=767770 RepID=A0A1L9N050_ASPTC|nr:hypothetical protein ASPTUDRAFT_683924 [Aspergillus tubingensis CBS 134.48]
MIAISSHLGNLSCSIIRPSTTIHDTSLGLTDTFGPQLFFFFCSVTRSFQPPSPYYCCNPYFDILGPFSRRWRCMCECVCLRWRSASVFESRLWVAFCTFIRGTAGQMPLWLCFVARWGRGLALSSLFYLPFFFPLVDFVGATVCMCARLISMQLFLLPCGWYFIYVVLLVRGWPLY